MRIAGVDVGEGQPASSAKATPALVTMEIESSGLPIHEDATVKIRPRIFLEGNWFVELQPGSPSARRSPRAHTIPVAQTADPVQLDQVLNALNTDTRANLQTFLIEYGEALTHKPTAAENAEQEAEVRGLTAAQALNKAYHLAPASAAGRGDRQPGARRHRSTNDLSKLVASIGKVTSRAERPRAGTSANSIVNFNTFFRVVRGAVHEPEAARSRELPSTLRKRATGPGRTRARRSVRRRRSRTTSSRASSETPATVTATLPWIEQVAGLARAERARRRREGPGGSSALSSRSSRPNRSRSSSRPNCSTNA